MLTLIYLIYSYYLFRAAASPPRNRRGEKTLTRSVTRTAPRGEEPGRTDGPLPPRCPLPHGLSPWGRTQTRALSPYWAAPIPSPPWPNPRPLCPPPSHTPGRGSVVLQIPGESIELMLLFILFIPSAFHYLFAKIGGGSPCRGHSHGDTDGDTAPKRHNPTPPGPALLPALGRSSDSMQPPSRSEPLLPRASARRGSARLSLCSLPAPSSSHRSLPPVVPVAPRVALSPVGNPSCSASGLPRVLYCT